MKARDQEKGGRDAIKIVENESDQLWNGLVSYHNNIDDSCFYIFRYSSQDIISVKMWCT